MNQPCTTLLALNFPLINPKLLQLLSNIKVQVANKTTINTKENILLELENLKPTFYIIASCLPGVIALEDVIAKVKQLSQKTKIILIINETDTSRILNYLLANVDAIIFAENVLDSLDFAIKQLIKEQPFLCGKTVSELRNLLQQNKAESKYELGLLELLTDRELEVLHFLAQGVNYKQISKILFISESTVKTHVNNIFTKLNVNDRTQAVLYALNHGIVSMIKKPYLIKNLINESIQK